MTTVFIPGDAVAVACGADAVADAVLHAAEWRRETIRIVRTGSRGMHWL